MANKVIVGNIDVVQLQTDINNLEVGLSSATASISSLNTKTITVTFDGAGSVLTAGLRAEVEIPYSGTVSSWNIFGSPTGSCVIDVLSSTDYSTYPTFNSIAGTEKPTLSSQGKNQDTNLTSFSTSLTSGNILRFNVDSASTVTKVYLNLKINL